jgi:hypothetical protein
LCVLFFRQSKKYCGRQFTNKTAALLLFLNPGNRRPNQILSFQEFAFTSVFTPGPEKALQTILPSARHNMDMKVRNTLTHAVIHGYKRPFSI